VFRKGIVRTFQVPRELKGMTVLENLMLVPVDQLGENLWGPWFVPFLVRRQERAMQEKALEVLEFVNLWELRNEYAGNLSSGQKKLLELARTLMCDPEMVLLDEPGAGVNPTLMKRLVASIEELCYEKGITFFIIEHDMDLIASLCASVIVMANGSVMAEGPMSQLREDPAIVEAYFGSALEEAT